MAGLLTHTQVSCPQVSLEHLYRNDQLSSRVRRLPPESLPMLNRQLEVHESLFPRVILLLNIEKNILGETRSLNFKLCLQRTLSTIITVIITIINTHDSITVITITTATIVEGTITMEI